EGVARLEAETSYSSRLGERARRAIERHATVAYLGTLTLLTALILGVTVIFALRTQPGLLMFVIAALVTLIPASDLAVSVLHWDITHLFEPRLLPNIDLSKGIPAEARTMVVVPVIFNDRESVAALIDKIEIAYLANRDEHLHFALLSDFADASAEKMSGDPEI